jgi:O-antigen ligase
MGVWASVRNSGSWYASVLAVGVVLERAGYYLWFEQPVFKGQALDVILPFLAFAVALACWLLLERRGPASRLLLAFLGSMALAWVVHLVLYRLHVDAFKYTALLYIPVLAMFAFKPLRLKEAWAAVLACAWATTCLLIGVRSLEMTGVIPIKSQVASTIAFDKERYFLPLNDLLGIDGRWPGPFGHNGDTAMMGALLIVIAFAHWTKASWVFLPVGAFTLLITSGRASMGAAAAGLVVMAMFTSVKPFDRVPKRIRVIAGACTLAVGAWFMYSWRAGLTGRDTIWPAFIELWQTSPWIGVGGSGIQISAGISAANRELTQTFLHAHSLYIDELTRFGVVGFATQFGALAIGVAIAAIAAGRGRPGPLGILIAYFVTGITEPRNSWISPTVTGFLVILMVVTAAASLQEPEKDPDLGPARRTTPLNASGP